MQAEMTFSENTVEVKAAEHTKMFQNIKPFQELQQCIENSDGDEWFLRCEKYINRFCFAIIIASLIYLTPVCVNIISR
jgi:hypothetical protein